MTEEGAFLRAILDDPDDDLLRLVYADWLEERADPRGEFIRVQYELARLGKDDRKRKRSLQLREIELISTYKDIWFPMRSEFIHWECRCGFWEQIIAEARKFLRHAKALFGSQPIQSVEVYGVSESNVERFTLCPYLERIKKLTVTRHRHEDLFEGILYFRDSPYLQELNELVFEGYGVVAEQQLRACFGNRVRFARKEFPVE